MCINQDIIEILKKMKLSIFTNIFTQKKIKLKPCLILIFVLILLFNGCAGSGGFHELDFEDKNYKDIKIFGMLDNDLAGENFGGFRFVFENMRDEWATLENVRLSFLEDSAKKYVIVLDSPGLKRWSMAILQQQQIRDSEFNQLQSALLSAGSIFTGISLDDEKLIHLATSDEIEGYPYNHLYGDEFFLPPNFSIGKWILFESTKHEKIPYVTNVKLEFGVDNQNQEANLQFRESSKRYDHFIWFDPTRK